MSYHVIEGVRVRDTANRGIRFASSELNVQILLRDLSLNQLTESGVKGTCLHIFPIYDIAGL